MENFTREDLAIRYALFQKFALDDQRNFYKNTVQKYENAASEVNRIRSLIALLTGFFSALAGLVTSLYFINSQYCAADMPTNTSGWCWWMNFVVGGSIILAVTLPALSAFFNMLSDLYQWDRLIPLYETAEDALRSSDALSPLPDQKDPEYVASYMAYVIGTLNIMRDETTQWGLSIQTPKDYESFKEDALKFIEGNTISSDPPTNTDPNINPDENI